MVWYSIGVGLIIGGKDGQDGGAGGSKNGSGKNDENSGAQGMFSLFGHQTWLYVGGIMGFGETFGPYVSTGPMIGADMDWALGGGVHFGKKFCLGLVVPLRQAYHSYGDRVVALLDQGKDYMHYAASSAYTMSASGLETLAHNPVAAATVVCVGAAVMVLPAKQPEYGTLEKIAKDKKNKFF